MGVYICRKYNTKAVITAFIRLISEVKLLILCCETVLGEAC